MFCDMDKLVCQPVEGHLVVLVLAVLNKTSMNSFSFHFYFLKKRSFTVI